MTVYTVHLEAHDPEAAAFVSERFSWGAFVFGPLWLLWNGVWLAALMCCAAIVLLFALPLGLSLFAKLAAVFLIALLCGFEGRQWLRQAWERRGKPAVDVVSGDNEAEAEIHYFHAHAQEASEADAVLVRPVPAASPAAAETAFGIFPHPEDRP